MITVRLTNVNTLFNTADSLIPTIKRTKIKIKNIFQFSLIFLVLSCFFSYLHLPVMTRHNTIANKSAYGANVSECNGK